jgi:predicted nucleic acid-binding Zn ribbon protein
MKSNRNLNGYVVVHDPTNPAAMRNKCWDGYVYEHIRVAQKFMGRLLREEEVVHHLDGDRSNNNPKNLLVIERSQHVKIHEWLNAGAPFGEIQLVNRVNCGKSKWAELRRCPVCEDPIINTRANFCSSSCAAKHRNKNSSRPNKAELQGVLESRMSMMAIGKKYGVSDNAVRKWCKSYDLDYKTIRSQARESRESNVKVQRLVGEKRLNNPTTTPGTQTGNAVGGEIVHGV